MAAEDDKHQTIMELKAKFDDNNGKLKQIESQRRQVEIALRRAAFTAAQLDELPDETRTYRSVGKAYFLQPKPSVMGYLEGSVKGSDSEVKRLAASRDALVKTQEGLRDEISELIQALRRG